MKQPPRPAARAPGLGAWLEEVGAADGLAGLAGLMGDAVVFAVDADRNVILWSEGAERVLGYPANEVLGRHCLAASRCADCIRGCGIAEAGALAGAPVVLHAKDGRPMRFLKTGRAFFDETGEFRGGLEVLVPAERAAAPAEAPATGDVLAFHGMLSKDPAMRRVFQTIRNVAETDATALVRGESGAGKELVARALHAESPRATGPFVAVNCAALTPTLMESELFGHLRGAFTGALRDRKGLFEQADGGTLFLDEVAELPLDVQAKLLRVLETHEVVPVGGSRAIAVDVRVVAATHRSLRQAVADGRFRADLMYRLRVVPIFLPALRERREDIEVLLWHFIEQHAATGRRRVTRVAPDAMRALLDHPWPGNVRELMNVVAYAFAVGSGETLTLDELPPEISAPGAHAVARAESPATARANPEADEADRLREALREHGGHQGRAAAALGISRSTLWRRRRRYGL